MILSIAAAVVFVLCSLVFIAKIVYINSDQYAIDQMIAEYFNKKVVVFGWEAWLILAIWFNAGAYLFH